MLEKQLKINTFCILLDVWWMALPNALYFPFYPFKNTPPFKYGKPRLPHKVQCRNIPAMRRYCKAPKNSWIEGLIQDQSAKSTYRTETCYSVTCCSSPSLITVRVLMVTCMWALPQCVLVQCVVVSASWHWLPLFSCWPADQELL